MPRRTHKMIGANNTVRGTGVPSQANSITSPSIKLFSPVEDGLPTSTIDDVIGATPFINTAVSTDCLIEAGSDAFSYKVGSAPGGQVGGNPAQWTDPATNDWLYFAVMRAIKDPAVAHSGYAVYIEISSIASGNVRIFPYMMRFRDDTSVPIKEAFTRNILTDDWSWVWNGGDSASGLGWECDHCEGWNLVDGEVYSIGGARRGDVMEHYFDGALVGSVNVRDAFAGNVLNKDASGQEEGGDITVWENHDGGESIELTHSGHSGAGCIDVNGDQIVGHYPAEWYGIAQFVFSGGLPVQESIEEGMRYMKEKWTHGDKIIYPEWITL